MSFFDSYFDAVSDCVHSVNKPLLYEASSLISSVSSQGGKVILAGNGGSAAIASHVSVDLVKVAGVRAVCFNEPALITCFANDFGYEHWLEKALDYYADRADLVLLISSGGTSRNILNGARKAKELGLPLITFSGFSNNNPLRAAGDLNFWADSDTYTVVEMAHHVWLLSLSAKLAADQK